MDEKSNVTEIKLTPEDKAANFTLPSMIEGDSDFSADEFMEEMDGIAIRFPRIKIPAGGSLAFEVPTDDPENPEYLRSLEGVILHTHRANGLWPGGKTEENVPPSCMSMDGKTGYGIPGGNCVTCAFNQWDSGPEGKGKLCKNMRYVYLLRDGDALPVLLSLPPTSLSEFDNYASSTFLMKRKMPAGSITKISLRKESNGSQDYSVAVFSHVAAFQGDKRKEAIACAKDFTSSMKESQAVREAEIQAKNGYYLEAGIESISDLSGFEEIDITEDIGFTAMPGLSETTLAVK